MQASPNVASDLLFGGIPDGLVFEVVDAKARSSRLSAKCARKIIRERSRKFKKTLEDSRRFWKEITSPPVLRPICCAGAFPKSDGV